MGRYRVAAELEATTSTDIDELRRSRNLTRERRRLFMESLYGAYCPPEDWGLQLRETQMFAVIAAEGTVSIPRIIAVVYGTSEEAAPATSSVRFQLGNLRKKLKPLGIEIKTTRDGWRFADPERTYATAQLKGEPPAPFKRKATIASSPIALPERASPEPDEELVYTLAEVAAKLKVSRAFIYNQVRDGHLLARKLGARTLVRRADLIAYIDRAPLSHPVKDAENTPLHKSNGCA